ncbi:MAG: thiamine diphosphokinase [Lachnospiraceae bacterium]|nr:thiamine diphosphokinase [Lachnospiraceae bacterium]
MAKKCIIIGAGDLTVSEILVSEEDYVIAADGGYSYCKLLGIEPDLILGDFDSVLEEDAKELAQIYEKDPEKVIVLPVEKDETDMLAAIHAGLEEGCREFHLYACQGGRLEHTIANIQCLNYLKECGAVGYMMDGTGMILVAKNETVSFQPGLEGMLSLFSLGERAEGVTIQNMKYELQDAVITNSFPIGISNEFIQEKASITVKNGTLVIIVTWG